MAIDSRQKAVSHAKRPDRAERPSSATYRYADGRPWLSTGAAKRTAVPMIT
jgi:hypothetical protein